jgi:small ligand-binding sensory domain FIST
MACNCIDTINGVLAKNGTTRIAPPLIGETEGGEFKMSASQCAIVTGTSGTRKRGERKVTVVAQFCPFCGQAYKEGTTYTGKPVVALL